MKVKPKQTIMYSITGRLKGATRKTHASVSEQTGSVLHGEPDM